MSSKPETQAAHEVPTTRLDDHIEFRLDRDAERGDVIGSLARLLLSMAQDDVSNGGVSGPAGT